MDVCETDSGSDFSDQTSSDLGASGVNLKSCSTQTLNDDSTIEVLDSSKIVDHMKESISVVADIINEDFTITRLLLSHFRWDKQALLERFYDGNKSGLFAEANITHLYKSNSMEQINSETAFTDAFQSIPDGKYSVGNVRQKLDHKSVSDNSLRPVSAVVKPSSETSVKVANSALRVPGDNADLVPVASDKSQVVLGECGICMTPAETAEHIFKLACGHEFCVECWKAYLKHSIVQEGLSQNITCAAYKCFTLVGDTTVMELVHDDAVRVKYQQLISNSFVACNKRLRWCPGPGCDKAIKAEATTKHVTCACGEQFCFQCGEKWHDPVLCSWIKHWSMKCSTDSSTTSWLASNTKECPKCNATIEKDGGCNHMVCRKDNCMYEFCWVCMGPWQEHGQNAWYNCNRFNEKTSKDARNAMEHSRGGMLRFLHYFNRFANHQQSMKLESALNNKVNDRIAELRDGQGQAWNEVKFLKLAVDVLCNARRVLMNTYIFAYFVAQNNQSMIFEDNQRDLELATEQLSEYLERDIIKKGIDALKQKVNDKASYCGQRCAVLVSHIREGYENGWWMLSEERRKFV